MLFTKTIIALALLSVGYAQPVTSPLARAPSDSVMRRAPYPYPEGEVRIATKRQFSPVPTLSKRGRASPGPPPPPRPNPGMGNQNVVVKTPTPAPQPTKKVLDAAGFAKLMAEVGMVN